MNARKIADLTLTGCTEEQASKTCGPYYYLVQNQAMAWTAFRTANGLKKWARERGLTLPDLPEIGTHFYAKIPGGYYENMMYGPLPRGERTLHLCNGEWTEATITTAPDGWKVMNYHNPNDREHKVVRDYWASNALMDGDRCEVETKPAGTTKHTPGPWRIQAYKHSLSPSFGIMAPAGHFVAKVHPLDNTHKRNAEADANACLIASAPVLLQALRELMERAAKDAENYAKEGNEPIWAFISDASDAIAQAEGVEQ